MVGNGGCGVGIGSDLDKGSFHFLIIILISQYRASYFGELNQCGAVKPKCRRGMEKL